MEIGVKMQMNSVNLTDDELLLLDGQINNKAQEVIDHIKHARSIQDDGLTEQQAKFIATVVERARNDKKLVFYYMSAKMCDACGKDAGYVKYARASKWHRKGETNFDRPLTFRGRELADSCIRFKHRFTVGCCTDCWNTLQEKIVEYLADVEAEIPEQITGYSPRYKRYKNQHCKKCGWTGHEGEMKQLPAMMEGYYPGGCPQCGAKNLPLVGGPIDISDGYSLVRTEGDVQ